MKTITIAVLVAIALAAGPALANPTAEAPAKQTRVADKAKPVKPEMPKSAEGSADEKSACLTKAGFSEADTPKEYADAKAEDADAKVFYISGSGKVALPQQHEAAAIKACGEKLGAKH